MLTLIGRDKKINYKYCGRGLEDQVSCETNPTKESRWNAKGLDAFGNFDKETRSAAHLCPKMEEQLHCLQALQMGILAPLFDETEEFEKI